MSATKRAMAFAAGFALLVTPAFGATAEAKTGVHQRHLVKRPHYRPQHIITAGGWRKRDNAAGWDNTCFNLTYLNDTTACGVTGR